MQKCIIISIRPEWVEKILNGEKTIEIRKSMPKCDLPIDVYIYCTKGKGTKKQPSLCCMSSFDYDKETGKFEEVDTEYTLNAWESLPPHFGILDGKIVAKFTLNKVEEFDGIDILMLEDLRMMLYGSCLSTKQVKEYSGGANIYAWHIDNLEIFDKPMELSVFYRNNFDEDKAKPCNCGKSCKYEDYDLQENQRICGIDYDGQDCPYLKVSRPPQSWCYAWR